jgi:hypothetical protein
MKKMLFALLLSSLAGFTTASAQDGEGKPYVGGLGNWWTGWITPKCYMANVQTLGGARGPVCTFEFSTTSKGNSSVYLPGTWKNSKGENSNSGLGVQVVDFNYLGIGNNYELPDIKPGIVTWSAAFGAVKKLNNGWSVLGVDISDGTIGQFTMNTHDKLMYKLCTPQDYGFVHTFVSTMTGHYDPSVQSPFLPITKGTSHSIEGNTLNREYQGNTPPCDPILNNELKFKRTIAVPTGSYDYENHPIFEGHEDDPTIGGNSDWRVVLEGIFDVMSPYPNIPIFTPCLTQDCSTPWGKKNAIEGFINDYIYQYQLANGTNYLDAAADASGGFVVGETYGTVIRYESGSNYVYEYVTFEIQLDLSTIVIADVDNALELHRRAKHATVSLDRSSVKTTNVGTTPIPTTTVPPKPSTFMEQLGCFFVFDIGNYCTSYYYGISAPGAASYQIQERPHGGSFSLVYDGPDSVYYPHIGLTNMDYRVRACNSAGCSVWSNIATAFSVCWDNLP